MYRTLHTPSIWREMDRFQRDMNRLINRFDALGLRAAPSYPKVNIWVNDSSQIVSAEMPGANADDIDIKVEGDTLTISGELKSTDLPEGARQLRKERSSGKFSRTFQLPYSVDSEKVEARYKNGVLVIVLPLSEKDKPRKIAIKN
ncbi:MAG: Hsp20/alpha crystallin family protein [Chloroflexota bacterium]|nr:MAG: Hsp20/alpha crystallin family protein [Chloroflexota bacterium]